MSSLKRNMNDNEIILSKVEQLLNVQVYPENDYSKSYFAHCHRPEAFFSNNDLSDLSIVGT